MGQPCLTQSTLPEFFREKVLAALDSVKVRASPHAEFYLVNLLTTFSHSGNLYEKDNGGKWVDCALATRFLESGLKTPDQRIPILKKLGDVSLYVSGFFADSLHRKAVNLDYYIRMGHSAYSSLSSLVESAGAMRELYEELAYNFIRFVNVLSEVADSTQLRSAQDLLRLYERWLATRSEKAGELLARSGIVPNPLVKTPYTQ